MSEPTPPRRARSRLPRGLAAFRHRNYHLFYSGQLVSVTGTWMQTLAQSWLVLSLTSSAFLLGLVAVFQFAPILYLGLFAGVVADRVSKRQLLVVTQAISAALAGKLAILTFTDTVQLWHVYGLAFLLGVNNAFDMPARQAMVVEMVGKQDLPNAIALNSSLFNAARIVGPAVAGVLLAVFGPAIGFALNAVSYIAVISGLLLMRIAPAARAPVAQRRLDQIREGLAYVRRTPEIMRPMLLVGLVATFGMNFNVWAPLLAKNDLAGGASFLIDGATDRQVFDTYVERVLVPTLRPGQVVVWDNLSAHKSVRARAAIEAAGCEVVFLPAYSPDCNPIELAFSKLKAGLRRSGERTHAGVWEAIGAGLEQITSRDAHGWFSHCGYSQTDQ